uniref:Uncharacterized protein n=1 Tax=Setaria viridis TaxID=4556 RepID=A0A4U6VSP2_SETVI|nr:hypothetical protein SEVIR_2G197250v2 [Setaria viridis]
MILLRFRRPRTAKCCGAVAPICTWPLLMAESRDTKK